MNTMANKETILNLKNGESFEIEHGDGSGIEIWKKWDVWILFEIPLYGGTPRYVDGFPRNRIDDMIAIYENWT